MDLGIVIVNWNVRDLLAQCLDSVYVDVAGSAPRLAAQVIVVDNASTDGSAEMLRARFPDTPLIQAENCGMGAGNNLGLKRLGFGLPPGGLRPPGSALILNPDTVVRPGALLRLVDFLRARPCAGVAAPKLLNPDGTLQHAGFRFPGVMQMALDLYPPPGRLSRLASAGEATSGRDAMTYGNSRPSMVLPIEPVAILAPSVLSESTNETTSS